MLNSKHSKLRQKPSEIRSTGMINLLFDCYNAHQRKFWLNDGCKKACPIFC